MKCPKCNADINIGSLIGSVKSERKAISSRMNAMKSQIKRTFYILSGEGDVGTWAGPYVTTGRGIDIRAKKARSGGDRWARVFEQFKNCVIDIANGETRDIPNPARK